MKFSDSTGLFAAALAGGIMGVIMAIAEAITSSRN